MGKSTKRKPDLRRIRPTKTYRVFEIAEALDRNVATVRRWLRDGLPTLDGQTPALVLGSVLKAWLKAKWSARKQKCKPDELFCFKCQEPRKPLTCSVQIIPTNEKTLSIKGQCSVCNARMNKVGSMAKLVEIEEIFRTSKRAKRRLTGCDNASTKRTSNASHETGGQQMERNMIFNEEEATL